MEVIVKLDVLQTDKITFLDEYGGTGVIAVPGRAGERVDQGRDIGMLFIAGMLPAPVKVGVSLRGAIEQSKILNGRAGKIVAELVNDIGR